MTDAHTLTREQVIGLFEEIDTLREHIRQLEEVLVPSVALPSHWGLTRMEGQLMRALRSVGPNTLHYERAMLSLYGGWDEAPGINTLQVMICNIRRKLVSVQEPIRIETVWGRGWRMTAESCSRFDLAVAADQARWANIGRAA